MTTCLLLACLLAAEPRLPSGERTAPAPFGPGRAQPLAEKPAVDPPPPPADPAPRGHGGFPLPASLTDARAKLQAILDAADAAWKRDVAAASDACTAILKKERTKAADAGMPAAAVAIDLEILKALRERDAAIGGSAADGFQLEQLKARRESLNKQLDLALTAEDLPTINTLDVEIKRINARIGDVAQEILAASLPAQAADALPATRVHRKLDHMLVWFTSMPNNHPYLYCFGKNGKWYELHHQVEGTWSVAVDGTVTLSAPKDSREYGWTAAIAGDRIDFQRMADAQQRGKGRILGPVSDAYTQGIATDQALACLDLPTPPVARFAEIPFAAVAARNLAARTIEAADRDRAAAVSAPMAQYIRALVRERPPPGRDDQTAAMIDRELARVRRLSDDLTGSRLVLEEERRGLRETRSAAIQSRDLDLANAADLKIRRLDVLLEGRGNRFADAAVFLMEIRAPRQGLAGAMSTLLLGADGRCRLDTMGFQEGGGDWKWRDDGSIEITRRGYAPIELRIDRDGMISGTQAGQPILGCVHGPAMDWLENAP